MGRLLLTGALACAALLAQNASSGPPASTDWRTQALRNALKGADLAKLDELRNKALAKIEPGSGTCLARMPIAKANDAIDPKIVRPVPEGRYVMPVVPPAPICGETPISAH